LVIFCVAFTEAIRLRRSFKDGMVDPDRRDDAALSYQAKVLA
jgi:hypothetical protein